MEVYRPWMYDTDEFNMLNMEKFYSTSVRRKNGTILYITAPLLICMAFHGEMNRIHWLLSRYPLLGKDGWTPDLIEQNNDLSLAQLIMVDELKNNIYRGPSVFGITYASAFLDIPPEEFAELEKKNPLTPVEYMSLKQTEEAEIILKLKRTERGQLDD